MRDYAERLIGFLQKFQHLRVIRTGDKIDNLDIRDLADGQLITIGYARNDDLGDQLNALFEEARTLLQAARSANAAAASAKAGGPITPDHIEQLAIQLPARLKEGAGLLRDICRRMKAQPEVIRAMRMFADEMDGAALVITALYVPARDGKEEGSND